MIIRTLAVTILLCWQLVAAADEQQDEMPSFGDSDLKEQFPEYQEAKNVERGLRRYLVHLESFRQDSLEGYNRAIIVHRENLVNADRKLEIDHKKGRINKEEYIDKHDYIKRELRKSRGKGSYFKAYFAYLKRYKSEAKWASDEILREEKKKFKF